jgi:hypothetical protein
MNLFPTPAPIGRLEVCNETIMGRCFRSAAAVRRPRYDALLAETDMKQRCLAVFLAWTISLAGARSQDWVQVHREDDAKWAHLTGLSAATVHKLWRMASRFANENDDDSRIDQLDLRALSNRNHVLLVTSSGADHCLRVSVFEVVPANSFRKLWTEEQSPDGEGFCATRLGQAKVQVWDGIIDVVIPEAQNADDARNVSTIVYQYDWKDAEYRYIGTKRIVRNFTKATSRQSDTTR